MHQASIVFIISSCRMLLFFSMSLVHAGVVNNWAHVQPIKLYILCFSALPPPPQSLPSSSPSSSHVTPSVTGSSFPAWCVQVICPSLSTGRRTESPLTPAWASPSTTSTSPAHCVYPTCSGFTTARTRVSPRTTPPSSNTRASSSSGVRRTWSSHLDTDLLLRLYQCLFHVFWETVFWRCSLRNVLADLLCSSTEIHRPTQRPGWDLWESCDPQLFCWRRTSSNYRVEIL